ncbi:MAG: Trm112 family protein [Geobacteraceae bacterium]|nr:Trm112 family protein [Geobacteraceae bacterium]
MLKNELMDKLACPVCKGNLVFDKNNNGLLCIDCGLLYPVRDDIPVLLPDEAIRISGR